MTIRNVQEHDYNQLIDLYQSFFKTHNLFNQKNSEIVSYLKKQAVKSELIVYEENGKILGASFLVNLSNENGHSRWKFRHFTFTNEKAATKLLKEAEKRVKKSSKTVKIELTIAENENSLDFFKQNDYEEEGRLTNHYRWGETCLVLSKSFS